MKTKRYHIIIDIENYDSNKFTKDLLEKVLLELPGVIDMHVLKGPVLVDGIDENPGYTGFVIIDYSHISIHSFSKHDEMLIDIFSCKPYNKEDAVNYLSKTLDCDRKNMNIQTVSWS